MVSAKGKAEVKDLRSVAHDTLKELSKSSGKFKLDFGRQWGERWLENAQDSDLKNRCSRHYSLPIQQPWVQNPMNRIMVLYNFNMSTSGDEHLRQ